VFLSATVYVCSPNKKAKKRLSCHKQVATANWGNECSLMMRYFLSIKGLQLMDVWRVLGSCIVGGGFLRFAAITFRYQWPNNE